MRGKMKEPTKAALRELLAAQVQRITDYRAEIASLRAQLAEAQQTDWRVLSFVAIAACGITLLGLTLAGLL